MHAVDDQYNVQGQKELAGTQFTAANKGHFTNSGFHDVAKIMNTSTHEDDYGLRMW
jgi:hypothetical protein